MQVDPLDSPKRIEEYNRLATRRGEINNILKEN